MLVEILVMLKIVFQMTSSVTGCAFLMDDLSVKSSLKNIVDKFPKLDGGEKALDLIINKLKQKD
jgi:hypothetical protein